MSRACSDVAREQEQLAVSCLDVGSRGARVVGGATTGPGFDPSERLATVSVLKLNLKKQQGTTTGSTLLNWHKRNHFTCQVTVV